MTQSSPVNTATALLTVIATLLPLLAVFLQFAVRFYSSDKRAGQAGEFGREAIFAILLSLAAVGYAGILAGDVVKLNTQSNSLNTVIVAVQLGFVFLLGAGAGYFIGRDIIREVSTGSESDKDDSGKNEGEGGEGSSAGESKSERGELNTEINEGEIE